MALVHENLHRMRSPLRSQPGMRMELHLPGLGPHENARGAVLPIEQRAPIRQTHAHAHGIHQIARNDAVEARILKRRKRPDADALCEQRWLE